MALGWALLCGVLPLVTPQLPVELGFSQALREDGTVELLWGLDRAARLAVFELRAQTTGWLGFGLSPNGGMDGADIVIGGVFPNKTVYFSDYHGVGKAAPVLDEKQDYRLMALTENGSFTSMRFSREFSTCDVHDLEITEGAMYVIAAYGSDDTIAFHDKHRSSSSVFLLSPAEHSPSPSISLTFTVTSNGYTIPASETTYACTFTQLPSVTGKHHIYKFEPALQAGNEAFVHHMVLHTCPTLTSIPQTTEDCEMNSSLYYQCVQVLVAWAVGGEAFQFPGNVGVSMGAVGDPSYIMLEIHYNNFHALPGMIDSSGIRLYYTPEVRMHDLGTLSVGPFPDSMLFIPPKMESYKVYGLCRTSKFTELDETQEEMQVFASLLHTHLAGRAIQIAHFRKGVQMSSLGHEMHYDFNLQRTKPLSSTIPIKVGDDIVVECTYNTKDRTNTTYGGLGTRQEMCLGLLYYYPRGDVSGCYSYTDLQHVVEVLGRKAASPQEAMLEIEAFHWDELSAWEAEIAAKESIHTVFIQDIKNEAVLDFGPILDIQEVYYSNTTNSSAAGKPCMATTLLHNYATSVHLIWLPHCGPLLFQGSLLCFFIILCCTL
ncbi:putative DBH-like monooxygenase protein 2 [Lissotriton helveticus]